MSNARTGFRSTASTLLNEQGFHPDLIELQLAHQERNAVRAAYNKAQRLTERSADDAGMGGLPGWVESEKIAVKLDYY